MKNIRPILSKLRSRQPGGQVPYGRHSRSVTSSAIALGLLLSGCAFYPTQLMANASLQPMTQALRFAVTAHPRAPIKLRLGSRLSGRERALLVPRSAPDCAVVEAKRADSVDAAEWERARLDYERSCYRQAEEATRDRLRRLQKAVRQTAIAAVPSQPPVKDVPRRDEPFAPFQQRAFGMPYLYGPVAEDRILWTRDPSVFFAPPGFYLNR
jgi:hypothetical protein